MDGARDPSAVEVKPAYTADGEWGWFGPNTIPGEQWANHITGEFKALLVGLGVADFDPLDDEQLAGALASAVTQHAYLRDGLDAVADPDPGPGVPFQGRFRLLSIGGVGSVRTTCVSDAFWALYGWNLGSSGPGGALFGKVDEDGNAAFAGRLRLGGDPGDPADSTHSIEFDGATGDGRVDGDLAVGGETTLESLSLSTGANKSSGSVTFGTPGAGETVIAQVFNTLIGADSLVLWELVNVTGASALAIKAGCVIVPGSVTFSVKNDGAGAVTGGEIRYAIINPA